MKKILLFVVCGVVFFLCYKAGNTSNFSYVLVAVILFMLFVGCVFAIEYFFSENDEQKMMDMIIGRMRDAGYKCEMEEGQIKYLMNGRVYFANVGKIARNTFRIEFLDYARNEDWEKISLEGRAVFANHINRKSPFTKITSFEKGFEVSFVTAINKSGEFLNKAKLSYRVMSDTFSNVAEVYPEIKRLYSGNEQSHSIGFIKETINQEE